MLAHWSRSRALSRLCLPQTLAGWRGYASGAAQRDGRYAQLEESDLQVFKGILGDSGVITDATTLQGFNRWVSILGMRYILRLNLGRYGVRCVPQVSCILVCAQINSGHLLPGIGSQNL